MLAAAALFCAITVSAQATSRDTWGISIRTGGASSTHRRGGTRHGARKKDDARQASQSPPTALGHAGGERLDNASVLALTHVGLGDPAIIAKIHGSDAHFDVGTDTLIALHRQGVSSAVLAAMIDAQGSAVSADVRPDSPDPQQPHPAGVYLFAGWLDTPHMLAIRPTATTRTASGGILAYAFSGGLVSVNYRAVLPSPHAEITAGAARPVFYFFTGSATGSQQLVTSWGAAPDPGDVALVRFEETRKGREIVIGHFNIQGASTGVRAKDSIAFSSAQVAPGVLLLRPDSDLPPGEYGFIQTAGGTGLGGAQVSTSTARIYDFAVADAGQGSREGAIGSPVMVAAADTGDSTRAAMQVERQLVRALQPERVRTTRVKLVKEANSSPSLYPGGK